MTAFEDYLLNKKIEKIVCDVLEEKGMSNDNPDHQHGHQTEELCDAFGNPIGEVH